MVHASLFSGIGGPEVAAAMLGWENAFHCEINPFGRRVLEYWFPESESYEDITKTNFTQWRGKIGVLTGGFPCQPFSYAGKRGGREDERYLWPEMLRAINEIRPTWIIGENVAGITTMVEGGVLTDLGAGSSLFAEDNQFHGYEFEQSFTIERICRDIESAGYSVQPMLIPAASCGAPHRRDRVFIIARIIADTSGRGEGTPGESEGIKGCRCHEDKFAGERGAKAEWDNRPSNVLRATTDTYGDGRGKVHKHLQSEIANGAESFGNGWERDASNPLRPRCEGKDKPRSSEGKERMRLRGNTPGHDTPNNWRGLRPEERWAEFPTQSPVHRGNDGLPFNVDDLSISFSKWRSETLKAYGNAIVPQVIYRIFQIIDTLTL